jgi:hypothetical protein
MPPSVWFQAVKDLAREGSQLTAQMVANPGTGIPGPGSGFGNAARYNAYVRALQATLGITQEAAQASAYLMATNVVPLLRRSLEDNLAQSEALATTSSQALSTWNEANGFPPVVDTPAFTAALARGTTAMTHDWANLTLDTQRGIARAVANGLVLGLHPTEVARNVHKALLETGQHSYSRGLLIARTEMQDMQANARLADLQANQFTPGWWWRARVDGCPVCQVQHGRAFPNTEHMQPHHMCRCVMVPIVEGSPEAGVAHGDYVAGEQRPMEHVLDPPPPLRRSRQQRGIPQSWRDDLPEDPRDLVSLQPNKGWRDSWRLQRPSGTPSVPKGPTPPPGLDKVTGSPTGAVLHLPNGNTVGVWRSPLGWMDTEGHRVRADWAKYLDAKFPPGEAPEVNMFGEMARRNPDGSWTVGDVTYPAGSPRANVVQDIWDTRQAKAKAKAEREAAASKVGGVSDWRTVPRDEREKVMGAEYQAVCNKALEGTGYRVEATHVGMLSEDDAQIRLTILGPNGKVAGSMTRYWDPARNRVENNLFTLDKAHQGKGIATKLKVATDEMWRVQGVTNIDVHANIDVGGYTWARQGFGWNEMLGSADKQCQKLINQNAGRADPEIKEVSNWLQVRLMDGNPPSPFQIAEYGRPPGAKSTDTWPGKKFLLNRHWYGTRTI